MFEDSLVESRSRFASQNRRWITVGSVGLQCMIVTVMVLVPILRPEALSFHAAAPAVVVPLFKKMPVVVVERRPEMIARVASVALPSVMAATRMAVLPSMRPVAEAGATVPVSLAGMGSATSEGPGGDLLRVLDSGPRVVAVSVKKTGPVRVSSGVSSGLLLGEIRPVYPRIAIAARVEGVVVIEATISKSGAIESARVVSGPMMLQSAAIEAVKIARYRPYRLNGEATEVQTTVTVNFRLGG